MEIFVGFEWWHYLLLFAVGLLSGTISPTFGIGGGLLNVPILLLGFPVLLETFVSATGDLSLTVGDVATVTSLGVIFVTALSGSFSYIREKRIDFRIAITFMIFAIPGAVSGALFSSLFIKKQNVEIDLYQIIFAITMILIATYKIIMIMISWVKKRRGVPAKEVIINKEEIEVSQKERPWWLHTVLYRNIEDKRGTNFEYKAKLLPGVLIATIGGFIGSLLGLGGGVIYVPILTMGLGLPAAIATATSTFTILFATPFGLGLRLILGSYIHWGIVICMATGTLITANIVPKFVHKIKSEVILTGFWFIAIAAAIRVLLKVLTDLSI
ncbi:MAG: sulfite exporter TauE/SafE family protein [Candidatus Heimdallarchaeota archaeon]|nr:sulfite exporter TauE/SafE family protein [Candidatus Heimdallarchaeota archaeon]